MTVLPLALSRAAVREGENGTLGPATGEERRGRFRRVSYSAGRPRHDGDADARHENSVTPPHRWLFLPRLSGGLLAPRPLDTLDTPVPRS